MYIDTSINIYIYLTIIIVSGIHCIKSFILYYIFYIFNILIYIYTYYYKLCILKKLYFKQIIMY